MLESPHAARAPTPGMNRDCLRFLVATCLLGVCIDASALGFGREDSGAVLGRPLSFSVELRTGPGDDIRPECTKAEVHFGDTRVPPSEVRVRIDGGGSGQTLKVTTSAAVDEPVVTVDVTMGCESRSSRRFVALSEPPTVQVVPAQAAATATQPARSASNGRRSPAPARPAAGRNSAEGGNAAAGSTQDRSRVRAPARDTKTSDTLRAAAPSSTSTGAAAAPAPPASAPQGRPRLQLDPVDAGTPVALAPEPSPEQAALENERQQALQRVQALEESLAQLRDETTRTRQALELLTARLREAENARYSNPLVYALLALCVVLGAIAIWLWHLRRTSPPAWWKASTRDSQKAVLASAPASHMSVTGDEMHPVAADSRFAPSTTALPKWRPAAPAARQPADTDVLDTAESESERTITLRPPASAATANAADEKQAIEVSIEELIDLEQQADFFTALGQDEAAIDLLESHVSDHPDASPLPYLKLLEVFKRREDREHYEEVRTQFNQRFNAYAPSWEVELLEGRSLEDYTSVISRLQHLWATHPGRAMEVLQASLLRRDGAQTFDLPAYRELLILYAVARDLAEREPVVAEVDLLLPLEDFDDSAPSRLEPLSATMPLQPYRGPMPGRDVDLQLDFGDTLPPQDREGQHSIEFEEIRVEAPPVRLVPDERGR